MNYGERYRRYTERHSNRPTLSFTPTVEKNMKRDYDIIREFLAQKDVPTWFRGLSSFQLDATDALLNAMRDDGEQGTSHRVRACLAAIGVQPLVGDTDLKFLMKLSRGNDIAFLWFLMEMFYKTEQKPKRTYNINEQLILSAISHLDMIPTLRELNRILPQGPSKIEYERQQRMLQKQQAEEKEKRKKSKNKEEFPYFRRLERPTIFGKDLYVNAPNYRVGLYGYSQYNDPLYVVPNENSRWFAKYKLMPSRRAANGVLRDTFNTIFFLDHRESTNIAHSIIDWECQHVFDNYMHLRKKKMLCGHHRAEEERLRLEREKHIMAQKERCLKHLEPFANQKKERLKNVMAGLQSEIDMYTMKYRSKIAERWNNKNYVRILSKDAFCEYLIRDSEEDKCHRPGEITKEVHMNSVISVEGDRLAGGAESNSYRQTPRAKFSPNEAGVALINCWPRTRGGADNNTNPQIMKAALLGTDSERVMGSTFANVGRHSTHNEKKEKEKQQRNKHLIKTSTKNGKSNRRKHKYECDCTGKHSLNCLMLKGEIPEGHLYDYGHPIIETPTPSKTYFHAPGHNKPYQFDYEKIFKYDSFEDEQTRIKNNFVQALEVEKQDLKTMPDRSPDLPRTAWECANRAWDKSVTEWRDNHDADRIAHGKALITDQPEEEYDDVDDIPNTIPRRSYYDCDDKQLMHTMLEAALQHMSKDYHFVLASMPHASKLPLLREWIYERYGKSYTPQDRLREFNLSVKIFRALEKVALQVKMPNGNEMGTEMKVDYSCRNYVMKKAKHLKKKFNQRFFNSLMEETRVFWFAMRPYLCTGGPPRTTYFSYMPSRILDITYFRPWKPTEYMNAKFEWEHRLQKKLQKEMFFG